MALTPFPLVIIAGGSFGGFRSNRYELDVYCVFGTVKQNPIGELLIKEITRKLRIEPFLLRDENGKPRERNAGAGATNPFAAAVAGQQLYSCENGLPLKDKFGNLILGTGTGAGSDSIVYFTPAQWRQGGFADYQQWTVLAGPLQDEILFHELVHSIRQMVGVQNCSYYKDNFDTREEVWSIMTTNIYSSAWGRPLRRDHHEFPTMTPAEVSGFYQKFEDMIGSMCRDLPRFTRSISKIEYIPFNPFRDYYARYPSGEAPHTSGGTPARR